MSPQAVSRSRDKDEIAAGAGDVAVQLLESINRKLDKLQSARAQDRDLLEQLVDELAQRRRVQRRVDDDPLVLAIQQEIGKICFQARELVARAHGRVEFRERLRACRAATVLALSRRLVALGRRQGAVFQVVRIGRERRGVVWCIERCAAGDATRHRSVTHNTLSIARRGATARNGATEDV